MILSPEECSDFYAEHYGKNDFSALITYMSGDPIKKKNPIVALVLARGSNTVADWLDLMGPEDVDKARVSAPNSIRARYGSGSADRPSLVSGATNFKLFNAVHGSESPKAALREISFFFPNCITEPLPSPEETRDFINNKINPTLIRGLTELVKNKPADPLRFLAGWLEENNPNRPQVTEPDD